MAPPFSFPGRRDVALFLSTYVNKIDKKGRISVPASFRAALVSQSFQGVVLFRGQAHSCLEGFGHDYMDEIGARLDRFDLFSEEQDELATAIFAQAAPLPFDGEGRIVLPPDLIAHAGLGEEAAFAGMGRKFQIWEPAALRARAEDARAAIRAKGLTLPKGEAA